MSTLAALARAALERIVEVEIVDRAIALAALAFTALVPLAVVFSSVAPGADPDDLADGIVRRFRLDPDTATIVSSAFTPPDDVAGAFSIGGALLVIASALSFTRALQRVYERAWRLPQLGVRATPAGLQWLVGVGLLAWGIIALREAVEGAAGPAISIAVVLVTAAAIWLITPWILLSRRVAWRALVATSLLTATTMTTLSAASVIYMPRSIADSAERYGPVGVSIALVSWLVAAGFVLVGCAAVGAVLGEDRAGGPGEPEGQERHREQREQDDRPERG